MAWHWLWKSGWHWTQRLIYLCLPSSEIKCMWQHNSISHIWLACITSISGWNFWTSFKIYLKSTYKMKFLPPWLNITKVIHSLKAQSTVYLSHGTKIWCLSKVWFFLLNSFLYCMCAHTSVLHGSKREICGSLF